LPSQKPLKTTSIEDILTHQHRRQVKPMFVKKEEEKVQELLNEIIPGQ